MDTTLQKLEEACLVLENDRKFHDDWHEIPKRYSTATAADYRNLLQHALNRLGLPAVEREDREALRLYFEDRYETPKLASALDPSHDLVRKPQKAPQPSEHLLDVVDALEDSETFNSGFHKLYHKQATTREVRDFIVDYTEITPKERDAVRLYFEHFYDLPPASGKAINGDLVIPPCQPKPAKPQPKPQTTTFPEHKAMTTTIKLTTKHFINGVDIASMTDGQIYDLIAKQEAAMADLNNIKNKPKSLVKELAERQDGIDKLVQHLNDRDDKS